MRRGLAVVLVCAALVVAAVAWGVQRDSSLPRLFSGAPPCRAVVDGHVVGLMPEQAENASLISAIAVRRGMPARAASIALATAYQESDLFNVEYGDRDSLGLFQQRPSQGWGTEEQVLDPVYAANAFYDALDRVGGYEQLEITVAAQEVQRSAFPDAYADHEQDARALASAFTGFSGHSIACDVDPDGGDTTEAASELADLFGVRARAGDRRVAIRIADATQGWAVAQYAAAQAERLGLRTISYDGRRWDAGSNEWARDADVSDRRVLLGV